MDWSLVLASQDIATLIDHSPESGWSLIVDALDRERALSAIRQYRLENRRWGWRQPLPWSDASFHWGGLVWCVALGFIYRLSAVEFPSLVAAARFDSIGVSRGEWWRLFTAILLHGDLGHLLTNVATGVVLFGLAMARYGAGCGLLAAYLAGAAGNVAGWLLYPRPYHGLGASGMVMGALGLITVPYLLGSPPRTERIKQIVRGAVAGVLLFVILGTNPSSDVIAHAGGFLAGILLGIGLNLWPVGTLQKPGVLLGTWSLWLLLLFFTSWLAWTRS